MTALLRLTYSTLLCSKKRILPSVVPSFWQRAVTTTFQREGAVTPQSARGHTECQYLRAALRSILMRDSDLNHDMAYSLSMADEESINNQGSVESWSFTILLDPQMKSQLEKSRNQCILPPSRGKANNEYSVDTEPLPTSLRKALHPSHGTINTTKYTAPFCVANGNAAWEEMCGYSLTESRGRSLESLLQGNESNPIETTRLIGNCYREKKTLEQY